MGGAACTEPEVVGTSDSGEPVQEVVTTDSYLSDVGSTDMVRPDAGDPVRDTLMLFDTSDVTRELDGQRLDTPLMDISEDITDAAGVDVEGPADVLAPFVYSTTCSLPEEPEGTGEVKLVNAFPGLDDGAFNYPMGLSEPLDGSNRLFVYERFGTVKILANTADASTTTIALNIGPKLFTGGEGGLLGMAIHPDYKNNGYVYLNYTVKEQGQVFTIVSRFTGDSPQSNMIDANSELLLLKIAQPYSNHNGGEIAFGPDGMLYVGMGDGGSGGDPLGHGQNLATLHGAMLRIDVDGTSPGKNYAIPADNPFAFSNGPEAPEIWAWGLRNPWRFSFDQLTGLLWAGDVGQKSWEEINILEGGKNYGWNTMEGTDCYPPGNNQCSKTGLELPVFSYPTGGKGSVTGGYVYRGSKVPTLYGTYIFADYEHKTLWMLPIGTLPPQEPAFQTPTKVAGLGQDAAGEVYVLGLLTGKIYRFESVTVQEPVEAFPQNLSETGCFSDVIALAPVEGVLPYDVNHPFWSSGADKQRFVVLPKDGKMTFDEEKRWGFPNGTLFIKHFNYDVPGASPVRLETRFLVTGETGVRGYVYRWNDEGTEAYLLASGDTRTLTLGDTELVWEFPARHQCASCHTEQSGGVLGLETAQLNKLVFYGDVQANQIEAMEQWGLFDADLPDLSAGVPFIAYPLVDDTATPVDERVRAWLHVNCSSCHDGSPASGIDLNLDYYASLSETKACGVVPQKGDLGVDGATIIEPGNPELSILYRRAIHEGQYKMPPIAAPVSDPQGTQLLFEWIDSLKECP